MVWSDGGREREGRPLFSAPVLVAPSCRGWQLRGLFGLDPVVCPESAEDGRVAEATPPPIHKLGRGQDPLKFD